MPQPKEKKREARSSFCIVNADGLISSKFRGVRSAAELQLEPGQILIEDVGGEVDLHKHQFTKSGAVFVISEKPQMELPRNERREAARKSLMPPAMQWEALIDGFRTLKAGGINVGAKMDRILAIDDDVRRSVL